MNTLRFFLLQHGHLHSLEGGGTASYADRVFGGVTDDQMRARPADRVNSLVWLLWHMARTEDAAVNLVVSSGRQVLEDDWARPMNIPWRTIGSGMTGDEVAELTRRADVDAVRAYRSAVGRRTREVVAALRPDTWDEVVGLADTTRAAAAGALAPNATWVEGVGHRPWQGHTRAAPLAGSAIRHNAVHLGGAVAVRSRQGSPWERPAALGAGLTGRNATAAQAARIRSRGSSPRGARSGGRWAARRKGYDSRIPRRARMSPSSRRVTSSSAGPGWRTTLVAMAPRRRRGCSRRARPIPCWPS